MRSIKKIILSATLLIILSGAMVTTIDLWAAPDQNPHRQTVPTRAPTDQPDPDDDSGGSSDNNDDSNSDDGAEPAQPTATPVPPTPTPIPPTATSAPTSPAIKTTSTATVTSTSTATPTATSTSTPVPPPTVLAVTPIGLPTSMVSSADTSPAPSATPTSRSPSSTGGNSFVMWGGLGVILIGAIAIGVWQGVQGKWSFKNLLSFILEDPFRS